MAEWHVYVFCFLHWVGRLLPRENWVFGPVRGGFFILQLHDELLYEVAEEDVVQVFLQCLHPFYGKWRHFVGQAKIHKCWVLKGIERTESAQCHTVVKEIPGAGMCFVWRKLDENLESCPEGFKALSILAETGGDPADQRRLGVPGSLLMSSLKHQVKSSSLACPLSGWGGKHSFIGQRVC